MTAAIAEKSIIEAGSLLTPKVRLSRPLAQGGMGTVWLADHLGLETQVAVKVVDPQAARSEPELLERLRREAALSARIRSVHTVQVFDCGVAAGGVPYLVMELLEGCTLDEWLELHGTLGLHDCSQIVAQLAKVLARAHAAGVVHRDLKPENVFLVDSDYELFVKLLDFGIAKKVDGGQRAGVTRTGIAVGTPGYISPEQALNAKRVDHRADLWSLAALAYRVLTGTVPFGDGGNGEAWWLRLRTKSYPRPSEVVPELPPDIDAWFERALDPEPDRRFQSAGDMAREFVAIAAGQRPSLEGLASIFADAPPPSVKPGQFDLFDLADEDAMVSRTVTIEEEAALAPILEPEPPPPPALVAPRDPRTVMIGLAILVAAAAFVVVLLIAHLARGAA
jgi:eukaryotic-like serine/threonine-protein kinase